MSDSTMTGFRTTFHGMFGERADGTPRVDRVEIPLIQRDYAQGRTDPRATVIRHNFLDALHDALSNGAPVGLDFVYGDVRGRRFEPLDGQQRLTTLFLLHWYVAARRGALDASEAWTRFTYATRPSARLFCERIVRNPPPPDLDQAPSTWITDQNWYLHLWRFDPTIHAMLVTVDAIAERFKKEDADRLWRQLVDTDNPSIWFQLLPIDDMGTAEELYIKMNSRGKPLTEFEAFKAHLGQLVAETGAADDFGHKIDGSWTDLLWPYRGDNDIVDDEFMRYFDFLIEVCEWKEGRVRGGEHLMPEQRVGALLATSNPRHLEHLAFICSAFDTWEGPVPVEDFFNGIFRTTIDGEGVRLVGASTTNLFRSCCERYGVTRGTTRLFSLTDTLLLHAVLIHRIHGTDDVQARLRTLRNVNEASQFEMRVQNMPKLVADVSAFMHTGDLADLPTFNQNQVADERAKRGLLASRPDLADRLKRLEDHTILRGTLSAFELDGSLATRAEAFEAAFLPDLWPTLTGAMLATGEYQRDLPGSDQHRFGSPTTESVWRQLLVDRGDRTPLTRVRVVLGGLLDGVTTSPHAAREALQLIAAEFVEQREAAFRFDWRYYLVRYAWMREGNSGLYYGADQRLGYELTMLTKTVQNSYYRDAYLYAIWCEAGRPGEVEDPWFFGYSTTPRWMKLSRSGVGMRSLPPGFAFSVAAASEAGETLHELGAPLGMVPYDGGWLLPVAQADHDGQRVDSAEPRAAGRSLTVGARCIRAVTRPSAAPQEGATPGISRRPASRHALVRRGTEQRSLVE